MTTAAGPEIDASLEAHRLVARFLHRNSYHTALDAFLRDAADSHPNLLPFTGGGQSPARAATDDAGEDLQDVVDSWMATRLARARIDDPAVSLRDQLDQIHYVQSKTAPARIAVRETSNILTISRGILPTRQWDSNQLRFRTDRSPCIFTTAVDRALKVRLAANFDLLDSFELPSPALSVAQHPVQEHERFIACATMEGTLMIFDLVTRQTKVKIKDHNKYIVRVAWSPDGRYIATAGYDKLLHIYRFSLSTAASASDAPALLDDEAPDPLATCPDVELVQVQRIAAKSNPEAAVWLPDSSELVWSARDDHLLHYVRVPSDQAGGVDASTPWEQTHWNLNPNGDAFVSFSVLSIELHPTLPLLSLQTSTTSARLLLYPFRSSTRILTLYTQAAQSDYFSPRHAWLPDGSAAVVNSEDGVLRVVDLHGTVRLCAGAHGSAAPLDEGDDEATEGAARETLRSERARQRREADKGSSVIRDVEVLFEEDNAGVPRTRRIVSCGFDKTVRVIEEG